MNLSCSRFTCRPRLFKALLLLVFLGAGGQTAAQNTALQTDADRQKEKIHIVADVLTTDSQARFAEFSGKVRAAQGETVITSDRLKIFYSEQLTESGNAPPGEGAIKKIIAGGNVRISFDNRIATAEEAVYDTDSKILVLTGPQAKISSGADSITGEKITYNRSDGRITVESGQKSRVEAVFHSGGGGIR